jgi:hypothetical protein
MTANKLNTLTIKQQYKQTNGRKRTSLHRSRSDSSLLVLECRSHSIQRHYRYFLPVYVPAFAAITSAVNRSSTNSLTRSGGLPCSGCRSTGTLEQSVLRNLASLPASLSHAMTFSLLSRITTHTDIPIHRRISISRFLGYRLSGTLSSVQCPRDCHARRISLSDQQRRHVIELLRRQGRWLLTVPATASTAN